MRRMKLVGLCLAVAFAFAVVAASTAAATPEWGHCVAMKGGYYTEGNCQTVAPDHKGSYEWKPGAVAVCYPMKDGNYTESKCETVAAGHTGSYEKTGGPRFTSEAGVSDLKAEDYVCYNGAKEPIRAPRASCATYGSEYVQTEVTCTSEHESGEVAGSDEVVDVSIRFKGCEALGSIPVTSPGLSPGEIEVNQLKGRLGYINRSAKPHPEVGLLLEPAELGGKFAEFELEGTSQRIVVGVGDAAEGSAYEAGPPYDTPGVPNGDDGVISPIVPIDQMTRTFTQAYTVTAQDENVPSHFEGGPLELPESFLENAEAHFISEWSPGGEELTNVNTMEGEVEIKGEGAGTDLAPTVVTQAATPPTETSATVNGTVNPNGSEVSAGDCEFQYGTTTSYGSSVQCSSAPGSGESPVAVSASITDLAANTTYHFRVVATNAHGTSYGSDETFVTLSSSASGSTSDPDVPAKAEDVSAGLSGTASGGTGEISVGQYTSDPVGEAPAGSSGAFIEIGLSPGNTFTSLEFTDCELGGAGKVTWWNPQGEGGIGEWEAVSDETAASGSPPCVTVTITETTSPTLAEVDARVFDPRRPAGPDPAITALSPKTGSAAGGTPVTITGSNLELLETVEFGSNLARWTAHTRTSITAILPPGAPGTVEVTVKTLNGTSARTKKDKFKLEAPTPTITGLSPVRGPKAGGEHVTITGTGFSTTPGATTFKFGHKAATSVHCTLTTECVVVDPAAKAAGPVNVIATVDKKKSNPNPPHSTFTYE